MKSLVYKLLLNDKVIDKDFSVSEQLQAEGLQSYNISVGPKLRFAAFRKEADYRVIHNVLPSFQLRSHRGLINFLFPRPFSLLMVEGLTVETAQPEKLQDWRRLGKHLILLERQISAAKFAYVVITDRKSSHILELSYEGYRCFEMTERPELHRLVSMYAADEMDGSALLGEFGSDLAAFFWDISALQHFQGVSGLAETLLSSLNNDKNLVFAIPSDTDPLSSRGETDNPLPEF